VSMRALQLQGGIGLLLNLLQLLLLLCHEV
jgi:hypothetical protein